MAEGYGGSSRESYIPAMLEMLGIPYTASDAVTIGICHDKSRCKEILYTITFLRLHSYTDSALNAIQGKIPEFVNHCTKAPLKASKYKPVIIRPSLIVKLQELRMITTSPL